MRLHDGVTPVLRSIQQAMHTTLNAFEQMQRATNQPINNRDLQMARDNINDIGAAIRLAEQEQERLNQRMRQGGSGLSNTNTNLDRMNQSINRATGSTDGLVSKIRQLAAISSITIAVKFSFGTFANFEQEMARVRAISGATAEEYKLLEDSARALGRDTVFSATEAAEGMKYLAMAGWKTNQIVTAMPGMLNLAAAGAIDLGETADIVSDTMTGFGLSAERAMHVADVFAETVTSTNTDVHMMGETMKYVAPVAKQFGATMEQTAAMTGLMAQAGVKATQAGTSLRSGMLRLADPRARAEMQLEKLGLTFTDLSGDMKDVQQIIREVSAAFIDLGESERLAAAQRIFGVEAATGWLALLDQGPDALDAMVAQLQSSDGASQAMADIMNDTLLGNLKLMASYAQDAMIEVGLAMRDGLKAQNVGGAVIGTFRSAIDFAKGTIMSLMPAIIQIGVAFRQLQPVITFVFNIIGSVAQVVGSAFGAIGEVVNGALAPLLPVLAGLAAGFIAYKTAVLAMAAAKGIATAATAAWTAVQGIATMAMYEYTAATTGATLAQLRLNMAMIANPIGLVIGLVAILVGVLAYFAATNDRVAKAFLTAWYTILDGIDDVGLGITNIFYGVLNTIDQVVVSALQKIEQLINGAVGGLNKFSGMVRKVTGIDLGTLDEVDISSTAAANARAKASQRFDDLYQKQQDAAARAAERQEKLNRFNPRKTMGNKGLDDSTLLQALDAVNSLGDAASLDSVDHVGSVGKIDDDVNISDEHLKLMEELVTQKYINQINLQVAAPQVTVAPTVQITKEADADELLGYVNDTLTEQAMTSAEQIYVKEL